MGNLLAYLRAFIFYAGYGLALVIHVPMCLVAAPFLSLRGRYSFCLRWNRFALWWLALTCGVRWKVVGSENLPAEPVIVLSNHQSPWETIFLVLFFEPICPILKIELLSVPFFGWGLRLLQPIAIDRSKRREARQTLLTQGYARVKAGLSVLVFPEGTRVDPGKSRKFSSGGAELAIETGASILPVAHDAGCFWPAHQLLKRPGTITVHIGPAIAPQGRDARELTEEVSRWTAARLTEMQPDLYPDSRSHIQVGD